MVILGVILGTTSEFTGVALERLSVSPFSHAYYLVGSMRNHEYPRYLHR